jgi:hypothetical protein
MPRKASAIAPAKIAPQEGPLGDQRPRSVPISPSPLGTVLAVRALPGAGSPVAPLLPLLADGRAPFRGPLAATAAAFFAVAAATAAAAFAAAAAAAAFAAAAAAALVEATTAALAADFAAATFAAAAAAAAAAAFAAAAFAAAAFAAAAFAAAAFAAAAATAAFLCDGLVVVGATGARGREVVVAGRLDVVVTDPANLIGAGLVVGDVGDVEEVVVGPGARGGGGAVVEEVEVEVTGAWPAVAEVPTAMTSLSAPAPTIVPLTKPLPVKVSVQL